ncbi:19204_t:CDS:1, partial [Cetraspora pellucida]
DAIDTQLIKCFFKYCDILVLSDRLEENLIFNYNQVEDYKVKSSKDNDFEANKLILLKKNNLNSTKLQL